MSDLWVKAAQFLGHEALLLDERRFDEWLDLLHDDLCYEMPLHMVSEGKGARTAPTAYLLNDDKGMIATRVRRLSFDTAHAEAPASRTVRTVGSICVLPGGSEGSVEVASTIILHRHFGIDPAPDIIHARRRDRLVVEGERMLLAHRTIAIGSAVLNMPNLAVFL